MLDALKAAHRHGKLDVRGDKEGTDPEAFTRTVSALYRKTWVVYAKPRHLSFARTPSV